mmetsp:Transcript_23568/g.67500  ORF Transcript_23568/g.67500 Transcript_23568/m.67500 type:complete len:218 (-) Transcript_23568:1411-2064(-)
MQPICGTERAINSNHLCGDGRHRADEHRHHEAHISNGVSVPHVRQVMVEGVALQHGNEVVQAASTSQTTQQCDERGRGEGHKDLRHKACPNAAAYPKGAGAKTRTTPRERNIGGEPQEDTNEDGDDEALVERHEVRATVRPPPREDAADLETYVQCALEAQSQPATPRLVEAAIVAGVPELCLVGDDLCQLPHTTLQDLGIREQARRVLPHPSAYGV